MCYIYAHMHIDYREIRRTDEGIWTEFDMWQKLDYVWWGFQWKWSGFVDWNKLGWFWTVIGLISYQFAFDVENEKISAYFELLIGIYVEMHIIPMNLIEWIGISCNFMKSGGQVRTIPTNAIKLDEFQGNSIYF